MCRLQSFVAVAALTERPFIFCIPSSFVMNISFILSQMNCSMLPCPCRSTSKSIYAAGDTSLTLERLPGGLSFKTRDMGTSVMIRGFDEQMNQFILKGTVQESTRLVCRVKDLKVRPISEHRQNFRLHVNGPAVLYYPTDETRSNPEECLLVDISSGGACIESEFLHAEDEVLRLWVKLRDYVPMEFMGEIIRVVEYQPGKFRYGFLFAQLKESELTELTRTLYNVQVGNVIPRRRSDDTGHW